jgi:hypothetical protein
LRLDWLRRWRFFGFTQHTRLVKSAGRGNADTKSDAVLHSHSHSDPDTNAGTDSGLVEREHGQSIERDVACGCD